MVLSSIVSIVQDVCLGTSGLTYKTSAKQRSRFKYPVNRFLTITRWKEAEDRADLEIQEVDEEQEYYLTRSGTIRGESPTTYPPDLGPIH